MVFIYDGTAGTSEHARIAEVAARPLTAKDGILLTGQSHPNSPGLDRLTVFDAAEVVELGTDGLTVDLDYIDDALPRDRAINALRDTAGTVRSDAPGTQLGGSLIRDRHVVRRLTPRECERLQGFHDDYTLIPYRGKLAADGPRYRAIGNSMAVPVMSWVGRRIRIVDAMAA